MELEEQNGKLVEFLKMTEAFTDPRIEQALLDVPRHLFVPENLWAEVYEDYPLPIGYGATISQPSIVANMTELLEPKKGHTILEIGTGSGWQAGILAKLVKKVYSVEIVPELADLAKNNLKKAGIKNVEIKVGQGRDGWKEKAPFDSIIVTAATPEIFDSWKDQLRVGGRFVAPVGTSFFQDLVLGEKTKGGWKEKGLYGCLFVPLQS
jgi:protein-L-isoaspartate(D-aspartate) O-methyltransferase